MKRVNTRQQSRSEDDSDSDSAISKKHKEFNSKVKDQNAEAKDVSGPVARGKIKLKLKANHFNSNNSDDLEVTKVSPANKVPVSPAAAFTVNGKW